MGHLHKLSLQLQLTYIHETTHLQIKEIDVERLKQLAEEQKAHIHVPFHSLKQSDEPQQTLLEKAEHTLEGEAHHLCAACMHASFECSSPDYTGSS